jgi:hypothetical protein
MYEGVAGVLANKQSQKHFGVDKVKYEKLLCFHCLDTEQKLFESSEAMI